MMDLMARSLFKKDLYYSVSEELTGDSISSLLKEEIKSCRLDLKNFHSQGYDNRPVMAAVLKGVQAQVFAEYPLALFTPCSCHSLNLVILDSAKPLAKLNLLWG
ncbi:hypothetical protein QYM36_009756 [Artemia franciscana]|uniref:DUF4371 domain-containing protein n=1 Tax=Artemia franciscana TaxID=6661 RepID=A0AA88L2D3_ARTSF|nr:hypothetical protein QYM36_009756 [Artemia franciscana]